MNRLLQKLTQVAQKKERTVLGLMSGTSADGLDIVLCRFSGYGFNTRFFVDRYMTKPFPADVKSRLRHLTGSPVVDARELCVMHMTLGRLFANMVLEALKEWRVPVNQVDMIASHGHTFHHAPGNTKSGNEAGHHATMQIGDGDHIAVLTGIITVSDFRQKDTARGHQGAPLAGYADNLLFHSARSNRIVLNIGGFANFSFIKTKKETSPSLNYDTGPGNILIDAAVQTYYPGQFFDVDGNIAASGNVDERLLDRMKSHEYFKKEPPRSTGFEEFNMGWVRRCLEACSLELSPQDLIATLTRFTVESISEEVKKQAGDDSTVEVIVSGGGAFNHTIMKGLSKALHPLQVNKSDEIGVPADAKEGLLFASMANELLCGDWPSNQLGKISLPDV